MKPSTQGILILIAIAGIGVIWYKVRRPITTSGFTSDADLGEGQMPTDTTGQKIGNIVKGFI